MPKTKRSNQREGRLACANSARPSYLANTTTHPLISQTAHGSHHVQGQSVSDRTNEFPQSPTLVTVRSTYQYAVNDERLRRTLMQSRNRMQPPISAFPLALTQCHHTAKAPFPGLGCRLLYKWSPYGHRMTKNSPRCRHRSVPKRRLGGCSRVHLVCIH